MPLPWQFNISQVGLVTAWKIKMQHTQGRDGNWYLTALLPSNWLDQTQVIGWSAVQSMQLASKLLNGLWQRHPSPVSKIRSQSGSLILWETGQTFNTSNEPTRQVMVGHKTGTNKVCEDGHICIHYSLKKRSRNKLKLTSQNKNKKNHQSTFSQWDLWIYSHDSRQRIPRKR